MVRTKACRRRSGSRARHSLQQSFARSQPRYSISSWTKMVEPRRPLSGSRRWGQSIRNIFVVEVKGIYAGVVMPDPPHSTPERQGSAKALLVMAYDHVVPQFLAHSHGNPMTIRSNFSSGAKERFVEGNVNGTPMEAFPDSGADVSPWNMLGRSGLWLISALRTCSNLSMPMEARDGLVVLFEAYHGLWDIRRFCATFTHWTTCA